MLRRSSRKRHGFSLVELLVVLAILGIIAGIAIPSFLGERQRARAIGDAQANARVISMALEARKAENGIFGVNGEYQWTNGVADGAAAALLPSFVAQGNTRMNFTLRITSPLTYTLEARDQRGGALVFRTNERGQTLPLN